MKPDGAPLKGRAIARLFVYNLMLVLPLLSILFLTHFGLSSGRLAAFFRRRLAASKMALAVVFLSIGAIVLGNLRFH